ncbi:MAG: amidohydrolase [Desulfobacterales bacterium]|nr:amidohydrolase [Desulfobacterales bacterium]
MRKEKSKTLFINAGILPGNGPRLQDDAMLVENGRISRFGRGADLCRDLPGDVRVIDCGGKSLVPGFIDAHNHMTLLGASLRASKFHYPAVSCIEDVVEVVKTAAQAKPAGEWIRGWGLDYGKFPGAKPPTRWDIDEVSPDHPVCIVHYTGHYVLVNSKALEMAGIDDTVADPKGGRFIRDHRGRITGLAQDAAQQMVVPTSVNVAHHGPDIGYDTPEAELVGDIECASRALLEAGVTTVVDPQVTTREMTGLVAAQHQDKLGVRTVAMYLSNHLDAQLEMGIDKPFGNGMLSIGPVKFYCDGAIVGGSAAFTEPLNNRTDNYSGSLYWEDTEALKQALGRTHASGLQFGIHTQGDRAHDIVLNRVKAFLDDHPREDHRHRLEHSGYPRPDQVEKMAEYGLIPITQPGQLREAGDNLVDNYGRDRATRIYPLREFLDNGIPAVISSDAFVQSYKPLDTIRGAVERISIKGEDMGQKQRISMEEALTCHTYNAAFSFFQEKEIGSLESGKLADVVLLNGDLFSTAPESLGDLGVELTMLGGEIVYQRENETPAGQKENVK